MMKSEIMLNSLGWFLEQKNEKVETWLNVYRDEYEDDEGNKIPFTLYNRKMLSRRKNPYILIKEDESNEAYPYLSFDEFKAFMYRLEEINKEFSEVEGANDER